MSEVDLMHIVDAYCVKHGREVNERNRLNAIYTNPAWLKRYPAWKAAQKKQKLHEARPKPTTSAQDQALVAEWLEHENKQRRDHNAALTTGVGVPQLEIGYSNGQVSFENALAAAKLWFESRQQEYDDRVTAAGRVRQQYLQTENERANRVLHQPIDPNDPVYLKYKIRLTPITDRQLEDYANWNIIDLQRSMDHVKYQAGLTIGEMSEHEWACVARWIQTNALDPLGEENWTTGALILTELQIIRRKELGPITVDVKAPVMPVVAERPVAESRPQGRAAEQAQREADTLREIRAAFGDYLTEIEQHDAKNPAEDIVIFNAYDDMMKNRTPIDRDGVRRSFFYAALKVRGERPSGFKDSEIDSWVASAEMSNIPAVEYRRQIEKYGNVSISRLPNETNALLEDLVSKLGRKA